MACNTKFLYQYRVFIEALQSGIVFVERVWLCVFVANGITYNQAIAPLDATRYTKRPTLVW